MFARILSRYWWTTLLRGVIWIFFGIVTFTRPGISLVSLAFLFGAIALTDGASNVISAIGGRHEHEGWWVLLLGGLAGIGVGLLTFMSPGLTALALLFYIAVWAVATGVLEIVAAVRLRKEIAGEFWLILAGVLSIAFGVFLMARPGEGALSVLWLMALYATVFGVVQVLLALKVRGFAHRLSAARA
jgi:uncharacterized membrane protein HdeD (DUF308 family)